MISQNNVENSEENKNKNILDKNKPINNEFNKELQKNEILLNNNLKLDQQKLENNPGEDNFLIK